MEGNLENIVKSAFLLVYGINTVGLLYLSYMSFGDFFEEKTNKDKKQQPAKLDLVFGSAFLGASAYFAKSAYDLYKSLVK